MLKDILSTTPEFELLNSAVRRRLLADPRQSTHRRRAPRRPVAGWTVRIQGLPYPVKNWNSFGFLASSCLHGCSEGDCLDIEFAVPVPGGGFESKLQATVVRVDQEKQEVAGVFVDG